GFTLRRTPYPARARTSVAASAGANRKQYPRSHPSKSRLMPTRMMGFVVADARKSAARKSLPKDGRNTKQSTSVCVKFSSSLFALSLCF
ncbi:MAG: hypothetical protein P8X69_10605, partial [Maritimibacter sp.]